MAPKIELVGWRESDWQRREAANDPFVAVLKRDGIEVKAEAKTAAAGLLGKMTSGAMGGVCAVGEPVGL